MSRTVIKVAAAAAIGFWLLSAARSGTSHSAAVRYAEAQIGKPYQWGGTGPWSFDCSGLAKRAEQAAGITIPRTSQEQWAVLRHIPASAVRPGDLVFFAGADGTMTSPGHVGVIVRPGLMIDSPMPGQDVREESYRGWPDLVGFADPGSR